MRGADGDRAPGNGPDPHGWHTVGARSASGGDYQRTWGTNTMSGFRGSGFWSVGDVQMGGRTGEGFLPLLWSQSVGSGFSVTRELIRNADSQAASAPQNQDLRFCRVPQRCPGPWLQVRGSLLGCAERSLRGL